MSLRDLNKLDIFLRVADAGSFSRAAEQLGMTQSGVSQHIQALEASLGTPLFRRERRGATLTEAGRRLGVYAQALFRLVAEAERDLTDVAGLQSGRVAVGATPGVSAYLLPDWIGAFARSYPRLTVAMHTSTTPQIIAGLAARTLDLAIIEGEIDAVQQPPLQVIALREVDQFVVIGPRHPWWRRTECRLAELHDRPMVTRQSASQTRIWLDQALRNAGITPQIIAELDNPESIKRMVMLGDALTILPDYAVFTEQEQGALQAIPIVGQPLRRTLKLVSSAALPLSPVARSFVRELGLFFPVLR